MASHTLHSHVQQLPNYLTIRTQTKTAYTAQNNKATSNRKLRKQHKMGNLYLLFAPRTKNHQPIQAHKRQKSVSDAATQ
jgi:hypothetical protein